LRGFEASFCRVVAQASLKSQVVDASLRARLRQMLDVSGVPIPIEVENGVSPLTTSTWWPLFRRFTRQIRLHGLSGLRWLFEWFLSHLFLGSVGYLNNLLSLALSCACILISDVSVPRCVRKSHLMSHAVFELIALAQALIKLLQVAVQVCLVKAGWAHSRLLPHLLIVFILRNCCFIQIIGFAITLSQLVVLL